MSAIHTVTATLAALTLAGSAAVAQQPVTPARPATQASSAMNRDSAHKMAGAQHGRKTSRRSGRRAARAAHDSSATKAGAASTVKPR